MGEMSSVKSPSPGVSVMRGRSLLPFNHPPSQARWGQTKGEGDFLSPRGHWAMLGDVFGYVGGGGFIGGCWYLVGGNQKCCNAPYKCTGQRSTAKKVPCPNVSSAWAEMLPGMNTVFLKQPDESHVGPFVI